MRRLALIAAMTLLLVQATTATAAQVFFVRIDDIKTARGTDLQANKTRMLYSYTHGRQAGEEKEKPRQALIILKKEYQGRVLVLIADDKGPNLENVQIIGLLEKP